VSDILNTQNQPVSQPPTYSRLNLPGTLKNVKESPTESLRNVTEFNINPDTFSDPRSRRL